MRKLNTFPVSYKVEGRRIVIIGGGEEALNKARLAIKTTASVVIVSAAPAPEFAELDVDISRTYGPSTLDGAALLFIAAAGAVAERARADARARGIPINVVDVPAACDFYTPSIVERAPLSVAIATEGDAPVLARLVRARIEAMLAPELGQLARLAGSLRARVAARLSKVQARRFYEDLLTGVGDDPEALLEAHAREATGEVWLVGAGPGAEDLLTLRAQRLLQAADVIVHDPAVPDRVIEMGRRDAERIAVGARRGHPAFAHPEVAALLIRLARAGKRVVRLTPGDPTACGRAAEEGAALGRAGIAYRLVPGVGTAAVEATCEAA
jgi:uroporphyrin-III C-methyltransferase/precorrin-2 dehydrogenase/sirohydrochlorin ferrochelatase